MAEHGVASTICIVYAIHFVLFFLSFDFNIVHLCNYDTAPYGKIFRNGIRARSVFASTCSQLAADIAVFGFRIRVRCSRKQQCKHFHRNMMTFSSLFPFLKCTNAHLRSTLGPLHRLDTRPRILQEMANVYPPTRLYIVLASDSCPCISASIAPRLQVSNNGSRNISSAQ